MGILILIGGPPRGGKTTLAQSISKETGIPWVSTDLLECIAMKYVSEEKMNTTFPKTVLRREAGKGNDKMYETFSVEKIVDGYRKQAEALYKAIEVFVEYAEGGDLDYIIEGYHITPKLLSKLKEKELEFSSVILVNSKPEEAIERSRNSKVKNDWVRDKTEKEETFTKISEMVGLYSEKLIEESKEFDVRVIDMGDNFQERCKESLEFLIK